MPARMVQKQHYPDAAKDILTTAWADHQVDDLDHYRHASQYRHR
jgi:hypothetical protein